MRRLAVALAAAGLATLQGFWLEPRKLLLRDEVQLGLDTEAFRIVHLSDLHVARETQIERRLLRALAAERPDLIVLSGDLVADSHHPKTMAAHLGGAAAVVAELRRLAPLVAVQGHSEYLGPVVAELGRSGVAWLSNEGRRLGPGRGILLLGLNQQVGRDAFSLPEEPPFGIVWVGGEPAFGRERSGLGNAFSHYDPEPRGLADLGGPLAWTAYEAHCEVRFGGRRSEAGLAVLSRYPAGEDRMIVLARAAPGSGSPTTTFVLVPHGTALSSGRLDTGIDPEPGRWYRLRLRAAAGPERTRVAARVWPAGEPEPADWQAWAEDETPERLVAGTVGLWARTHAVAYRHLRVTALDGSILLDEALAGPRPPAGFRDGTRDTRLALALARSPEVAAGTPVVALSHVPDPVLEASYRGLDAVLAGHTHGGQVRLPGGLAFLTRSRLGPRFDRGVFDFAAPNPRGWTRLYVNSGVGTSVVAVRLFCPPSYAVVEVAARR